MVKKTDAQIGREVDAILAGGERPIYAYVTSYCNHAHRMSDGKPIKHECRIIPPRALKLEREGDIRGAIDVLMHAPFRHHTGTRK
jgi:hypothetical protein